MTNWERLLDLPLREVIKEFDRQDAAKVVLSFGLSDMMLCDGVAKPCSICDFINSSCAGVCEAWLDREADPNANYNEDVWHNAANEDPPTSDTTIEYIVLIHGANQPTVLGYDGEFFLDDDANAYSVDYWRPMPKLPEDT